MKKGTRLSTLSYAGFVNMINVPNKRIDLNTLGLYRAIVESKKLDLAQKIEIRDLANAKFQKTFDFLQLKDPYTYFTLTTLGLDLTAADENQRWNDIRTNQEKILNQKKIKHRNFGEYSKHNCGRDNCPYDGVMIRQGSKWAYSIMHFDSDKHGSYNQKEKSDRIKKERKNMKKIIQKDLD